MTSRLVLLTELGDYSGGEDNRELSPGADSTEEDSTDTASDSDTTSSDDEFEVDKIPVEFVPPSGVRRVQRVRGLLACGVCHTTMSEGSSQEVAVNVEGKRKVWLMACKGSCVPTAQIHEDAANLTVCRFCGEERKLDELIPRYNAHYKKYFNACKNTCPKDACN